MKNITSAEMFDTTRGKIFVISENIDISIGEEILINGKKYAVKNIIFPTAPTNENKIAIVV